ncbi:MAG: STAS/SEC14 domain-containing protein [Anaerolineales bacterium]|nr:STAS/SEC14 domain-containing protein [Anaerolineales bacterium]
MGEYTYTITLDEGKKLVHLVVEGELDQTQGQNVIIETRAKAVEHQYKIFCDITQTSIIATMADWFFLARNQDIYPKAPMEKTAILINPETQKTFKFVENVTRNVGINIKFFLDKEDALEWLEKE